MRPPLIVTAEVHTVWRNSERKIQEDEARERSYRAQLAEKLSAERNRAAVRTTLIRQFLPRNDPDNLARLVYLQDSMVVAARSGHPEEAPLPPSD